MKYDKIVVDCLLSAVESSFCDLLKKVDETFYYCTLVMQELATPYISAMSYEALERLSASDNDNPNYKWSYADSPYCGYGYNEFFAEVEKLFISRFEKLEIEEDIEYEYAIWISSMEEVMRILDRRGVFGLRGKENNIFINAEIMPPDDSNFERGKRLNPTYIYEMWKNDWVGDINDTEINWDEIWHPKTVDVVLTLPIYNKKTIIKIKRAFELNVDITSLIHNCANVPYVIIKGGRLDFVNKALDDLFEIRGQIEIQKGEDS